MEKKTKQFIFELNSYQQSWYGNVAEWSKALVSGTSHYDGVGSNPTTAIHARSFEAGNEKEMMGKKFSCFNICLYFSLLMLLRNN